jgi:hypothetical protein
VNGPARMTAAQYRNAVTARRTNKYRAKRVKTEHGDFDSISEAKRYADLAWRAKAGLIANLRRQVKFPLFAGDKPIMLASANGQLRQAVYIADYVYDDLEIEKIVVEDRKGTDTRLSQLKRAILATMLGSSYEIRVTRAGDEKSPAKPPRRARRGRYP